MAALTKTQLDHARLRIREARAHFLETRAKACGPCPEPIEYNGTDKIELIAGFSANAILKSRDDLHELLKGYHSDFLKAFTFVPTTEMETRTNEIKVWKLIEQQDIAKADKIENELLDDIIMSPDGAAALMRIASAFTDV